MVSFLLAMAIVGVIVWVVSVAVFSGGFFRKFKVLITTRKQRDYLAAGVKNANIVIRFVSLKNTLYGENIKLLTLDTRTPLKRAMFHTIGLDEDTGLEGWFRRGGILFEPK